MNSFAQTLNQYSFVILYLLGLGVLAFVLYRRHVKLHWWGVWGSLALVLLVVITLLRTPLGTVQYAYASADESSNKPTDNPLTAQLPDMSSRLQNGRRIWFLAPEKPINFDDLIRSADGRYTLVEFYSDLGIL